MSLQYKVATLRSAGLEAKWSKTRSGSPILVARALGTSRWYYVDKDMWKHAQVVGIKEAFGDHTCLGDIFSIIT